MRKHPLEHKIENDVLLTSSERRMNDERKFTLYLKIQYNLRNDLNYR